MFQINATSNEMVQLVPTRVSALSYTKRGRWQEWAAKMAVVTHTRLSQFCMEHPRDLGATLNGLEKSGILETTGQYRAKTYHIPGHMLPTAEDVFESTTNLEPSTTNLESNTTNLEPSTTNLDEKGRIVHVQFSYPFVDDIATLTPAFRQELETIAQSPRTKKKLSREEMIQVILELCRGQYVTSGALSVLLNREITTLRGQYLAPLKAERKLQLAFPRTPTDPKQAYLAT